MKQTLMILIFGACLYSCNQYSINTPCDCVKMQIDMLEGNGPRYGQNFGLCKELKHDKSPIEINRLQREYENCPEYQRLKEEYIPFIKDKLEKIEPDTGMNEETINEAVEILENY